MHSYAFPWYSLWRFKTELSFRSLYLKRSIVQRVLAPVIPILVNAAMSDDNVGDAVEDEFYEEDLEVGHIFIRWIYYFYFHIFIPEVDGPGRLRNCGQILIMIFSNLHMIFHIRYDPIRYGMDNYLTKMWCNKYWAQVSTLLC